MTVNSLLLEFPFNFLDCSWLQAPKTMKSNCMSGCFTAATALWGNSFCCSFMIATVPWGNKDFQLRHKPYWAINGSVVPCWLNRRIWPGPVLTSVWVQVPSSECKAQPSLFLINVVSSLFRTLTGLHPIRKKNKINRNLMCLYMHVFLGKCFLFSILFWEWVSLCCPWLT